MKGNVVRKAPGRKNGALQHCNRVVPARASTASRRSMLEMEMFQFPFGAAGTVLRCVARRGNAEEGGGRLMKLSVDLPWNQTARRGRKGKEHWGRQGRGNVVAIDFDSGIGGWAQCIHFIHTPVENKRESGTMHAVVDIQW